MLLTIRQMSGIAPKIDPTQLKDNAATVALNCRLDAANVRPLRAPAMLRADWGTGINSLYRFGQEITDPTLYWFRSANDVSYLKAPFFGDTRELTFLTESGELRYTTNTAALTGEPYPSTTYEIPGPPTGAMSSSLSGAGEGVDITFAYVMTVSTAEGFTTRPGSAKTVVAKAGNTVTLTQQTLPSGAYNFGVGSVRKLWRSTNSGTFELRAQKNGADATDWVDVVSDSSLSEVLEEPWNLEPPSSGVHSLVGMPGFFVMIAAGKDLYPSKSAPNVHGFPEDYRITLEHTIVGVCAIDSGAVVGTHGYPAMVIGSDPASLQPVYLRDFKQACASRRSMVAIGGGVVYASPDGLVLVSQEGCRVLTENVFTRDQWQAFNPSSIHAYAWEGQYVGFYDAGGGVRGGFIFDPRDGREPFMKFDTYATAGFYEPLFDRLYLQVDNDLMTFDAGTPLSFTWTSKLFTLSHAQAFAAAQVKAHDYTDLQFRVIADGTTLMTRAVSSGRGFRLPATRRYSTVQIEITGRGTVFEIKAATSMTELGR